MLVDFSVKNYLSFKESVTFSMIASPDKTLWDTNVIENAQGTGLNLLKSAIIYGHNASGKSNLIKALYFMSGFMNSSTNHLPDRPIETKPFKMDASCLDKPSEFDIRFIVDGTIYNYGFSVDKHRVHQEWLYSFPKTQKRILFERNNNNKDAFYFGSHFKGEKNTIAKLTREDSLFLTVSAQYNHELSNLLIKQIHKYSSLPGLTGEIAGQKQWQIDGILLICRLFPEIVPKMKTFLGIADTGMSDFLYDIDEFDEKWDAKNRNFNTRVKTPESDTIKTFHRIISDKGDVSKIELDINEESDGTIRWLSIAGIAIIHFSNGDSLILDEFDAKLHPALSRELVSMFHNEKVNPKNAQFVGTTHNTDLLDKDLLRRDQIWFTEKKHDTGATDLYSLWDFKKKPRKEEDYRKNYLSGRYGAIPILEKFEL
ncbi:MAG TPA: ATP-binding protein [bacterium]|nr:ATP-binding protein [bacterium]